MQREGQVFSKLCWHFEKIIINDIGKGESKLNSKSFEDRDSKLGFLVKLITLVEMVNEEKIDVKPSMVLAG